MVDVLSYFRPKLDNSKAHSTILPVATGFRSMRCKGKRVTTVISWAWKQCCSFLEAMMRPKINFCTPEYLDLAPRNKELTKYTGRCTTFFLATSLGLLSLPCSLLS